MATQNGDKQPIVLTERGRAARTAGLLIAGAVLGPPAAHYVADGISNTIDQGLKVEQPAPMYDNPALVGVNGTITTESGKKAKVTMPELTPTSPTEALPQDQLPNANNGPGLHTT